MRHAPVLEAPDIARVLTRIAHEIVERAKGADDVVLLGIPTRGVFLARRLAAKLEEITGRKIPVGSLDITMYRDDLRLQPAARAGPHRDPRRRHRRPPGRPRRRRALLRPHHPRRARRARATSAARAPCSSRSSSTAATANCPIRADYVGKNLPTSLRETVKVQLAEEDGRDAVLLGAQRTAPADEQ